MLLLELFKKFVTGILLSLILQSVLHGVEIARADVGDRFVVKTGWRKSYILLPPKRRTKTLEQQRAEAKSGRDRFKGMFDQAQVPQQGSLIEFTTPVKDQWHRGTCVAFASNALVETLLRSVRNERHDLSEQWIYWVSKAKMHFDPHQDGSEALPMLKGIEAYGVPEQQFWPYQRDPWFADKEGHSACYQAYSIDPVNMNVPTACVTNGSPPPAAVQASKIFVRSSTQVETSPEAIVGFIQNKIPVEVGFDVYDSAFHFPKQKCSPNDSSCLDPLFLKGVVSMPAAGDTSPTGGHEVLIVGYDLKRQFYVFKNSWGTDEWASKSPIKPGFGVIPMEYVRRFGVATVALLK